MQRRKCPRWLADHSSSDTDDFILTPINVNNSLTMWITKLQNDVNAKLLFLLLYIHLFIIHIRILLHKLLSNYLSTASGKLQCKSNWMLDQFTQKFHLAKDWKKKALRCEFRSVIISHPKRNEWKCGEICTFGFHLMNDLYA